MEGSSFEEVEKLIKQLYNPGNPQQVKHAEEHLQMLQRSPQGWQLADALLQSLDNKVRFFGALTFTVKIKRDWESLSEADAISLLERLLHHLVRLVNSGEGPLVIRKLCTALIAYHLQQSTAWHRCLLHVMACFANGEVLPSSAVTSSGLTPSELPARLNQAQILASLWFASGLAEDGRQALVISAESNKRHKKIASNVDDAVSLLRYAMEIPTRNDTYFKRAQEALKCFQSWVMYAQRAWVDKALELGSLQILTPCAIQFLKQEDVYEEAAEMLSDVLANFSAFFTANDYKSLALILSSQDAQNAITELKSGDFNPLASTFSRLLMAYGDANVQELARSNDAEMQQILDQLLDLLRCEGYPGVDDEIWSQALDFWTTYVEFVTDSLFTVDPHDKPLWMQRAQQQTERVLEACWAKIRQPPSNVAATWNSDSRAGFQSFRSDVQDLLQTSYTLLGLNIFEKFAWLALQALQDRAWLHLEATLFCVNALSEAVADEASVDEILSRLFGSSLFADMANQHDAIPTKTRQIAVSMITNYIGFFERRVEHMPAMLTFLFECVKAPAMVGVAAKAIQTACSSCRKELRQELDAFLNQYEAMISLDTFDFYGKEKVIGGIAAIIQALPSDEYKLAPLMRLVQTVQRDVDTCLRFMRGSSADDFQNYGIGALKCLVSIGKSLQTPDDVAIDLDSENASPSIWSSGPGKALQVAIVDMFRKLTNLMSWNSDVMEAGCQILRAGYKETQPGLFVFPAQVTIDFVQATTLNTSRMDLVYDTASVMLGKRNQTSKDDLQLAATCFFEHSMRMLESLSYNPSAEPEVASSIVDLADKMISNYIPSMMQNAQVSRFLAFTLSCLKSPEILPSRSAAHFWATLVSKQNLTGDPAQFINAAVSQYGPETCRIIIYGIAGEAPRSALEVLGEPLKKLIFAQPRAKQWLSDALHSNDFPSRRVTAEEKNFWLEKVMSLRGARKTNNEVRDFWIACRGAENAFAFG